MRIKIINPNTTDDMTRSIVKAAEAAARPGTTIIGVSNPMGPESIECYVDEYMAVPGLLAEILKGDGEENIDAYVLACFCDPGLQAAREATDKPVLGIAHSAMMMARTVAPYFSVVSVLERSRKVTEDVLVENGMEKFCRSIRTTGLSVLEFGENPEKGLEALLREAKKAIELDGAECILLGCAGFVDFVSRMKEELGVPVLDGVAPAVKFAEALCDLGMGTSKANTWSRPEVKVFRGYGAEFNFK